MKNHNDPSTTQRQSETPVPTNKISVLKLAQLTLKTIKFVKLALVLLDVSGISVAGLAMWDQIQELIEALLDCIDIQ